MYKKHILIFLPIYSILLHSILFAGNFKPKKPAIQNAIKLVKTQKPNSVQYKLNGITFELKKADILSVNVNAIVNAANENCLGGHGIDGYISAKGGASLLAARKNIPLDQVHKVRCPETQTRITRSGEIIKQNSHIKFVAHAVGPMATAGGMTKSEKQKLANTYLNALKRVNAFNKNPKDKKYIEFDKIKTSDLKNPVISDIAFPTIGTGIYNCSTKDSASSVVRAILNYAKSNKNQKLKHIIFVFHDPKNSAKADQDFKYYKDQFDKYL